MRYKIVHNGYKIEYADTMNDVEKYIYSVISKYDDLHPKKIFDRAFQTSSGKLRIIRYRYDTIYEEDFFIEPSR